MEKLETVSQIRPAALRGDRYLESLLEAACGCGLLTAHALEQIQLDLLALLAKRIERYNGGDSSVPVETAQSLMASLLFTVGVQLKTLPNPDDAVAALQTVRAEALYAQGRQRIAVLVRRARRVQKTLLTNLLETENVYYRATAETELGRFFRRYDPEFFAQEIHMTADYPVYNPLPPADGIEFVQPYLAHFTLENQFCLYFSRRRIEHLLRACDRHYEQVPMNLYEPVLAAALGSVLVGAEPLALALSPMEVERLGALFSEKSPAEVEALLAQTAGRLRQALALPRSVQAYVLGSLPQLAAGIARAVAGNTLERVFPVPCELF